MVDWQRIIIQIYIAKISEFSHICQIFDASLYFLLFSWCMDLIMIEFNCILVRETGMNFGHIKVQLYKYFFLRNILWECSALLWSMERSLVLLYRLWNHICIDSTWQHNKFWPCKSVFHNQHPMADGHTLLLYIL